MQAKGAFVLGESVPYEQNIRIYPPKVRDVLANEHYGAYVNIFTISQEDIWDMIAENEVGQVTGKPVEDAPTPLDFLLINCYKSEKFTKQVEEAFKFFTHEDVKVLPKSHLIIFTSGIENIESISDLRKIENEDQYFKFQNLIRAAADEKEVEPPNKNENPRVALIKAKGRMRERLKKKKGSANSISLDTILIALCCMNNGLNPLNIGEISYIAMNRLIRMSQEKERYETEMRVLTSGFASKKRKSPKYWIQDYTI